MSNIKPTKQIEGNITRIFLDGVLYCEDEPAVVEIDEEGKIIKSKWYYMGKLHTYGTQKCIKENKNDGTALETTYCNGKLHSYNDIPSIILYNNDRIFIYKKWHKDGSLFRENDLPAVRYYDDKGNIEGEEWYENGVYHRNNDLPSILRYFGVTGTIIEALWYVKGIQRRDGHLPDRKIRMYDRNVLCYKNEKLVGSEPYIQINDEEERCWLDIYKQFQSTPWKSNKLFL